MSGDLKWNKILGAGLATAFVIVGLQQVTAAVFHTEKPEKMGYFVDAPDEAAGGEAAALPIDWGTVLPVADVAAGEAAFARCQACHNIAAGGANGIGPNLYGVLGGPVMHMANFAYSDAMSAHKAEAPTWGYDQIDAFLTAPGRYVPGTKMSFAGIRDEQTRINLIAYLRTQGSSLAIPAPDPARQPGAAAPAAGEAPAEGAVATEGAAAAPVTGAPATTQATPAAPPAATSPAPPNA